ncbi:MAG: ComF family protein [Gammaproteobacteria bacterium]|nr:ComF family protein [Pseudomonadales bacterium]MCP5347273.1 ComF family protein [Pseudomonadales bacterium]
MRLVDRIRSCLPASCILCNLPVRGVISLCDACRNSLPEAGNVCQVCGAALEAWPAETVCGRCQLNPPCFDHCHGVFFYEYPLSNLITEFKFHDNLAAGRVLGWLLARAFQAHYSDTGCQPETGIPCVLVPVPLHDNRLQKRGFNQALLLARQVSQCSGIPVCNRVLERVRDTPAQSGLSARRRVQNPRGAFRLLESTPAANLEHIAVIDDVVTTTATVAAVAAQLRHAGAQRIDIWAVARTRS